MLSPRRDTSPPPFVGHKTPLWATSGPVHYPASTRIDLLVTTPTPTLPGSAQLVIHGSSILRGHPLEELRNEMTTAEADAAMSEVFEARCPSDGRVAIIATPASYVPQAKLGSFAGCSGVFLRWICLKGS